MTILDNLVYVFTFNGLISLVDMFCIAWLLEHSIKLFRFIVKKLYKGSDKK